jgi:glycogen synthase
MTYRIFHATGPGDIIQAHKYWSAQQQYPNEMSITFSSQFEEFCRDVGAEAYIIASHAEKAISRDGSFTLEHRPKLASNATGMRYHIAEVWYGIGLFLTAVRFRANAAVLDSGCSHYFILSLFSLAGIKTIVVMHNALWPSGFPPNRAAARILAKLDSLFFRWLPVGTIGVSPECIRQVDRLTNGKHTPLYQFRVQFLPEYFQAILPPPPHDQRPFQIVYVGRIVRNKGVFDVLEIAKRVDVKASGRVQWEVCGSGPDLEELRQLRGEMGLKQVVSIRGWTSPRDLQGVLSRSHVSIVPTRSNCSEGFAMTAVEAVLAGRPVITSRVVPALEVLKPACIEARTDDVDSYVDSILRLIDDANQYRRLCRACPDLQGQFYDREHGLAAVLQKILSPMMPPTHGTPGKAHM